jgi:hypothetical protein
MCKEDVGSQFGRIPVCEVGVGSPFGRIPSELEHSEGSESSWKEWMTGLQKDSNCWNRRLMAVGSVGKTLPACKAEADHGGGGKGGQGGHKVGLSSSKVNVRASKNGSRWYAKDHWRLAVETVPLYGHSWYK